MDNNLSNQCPNCGAGLEPVDSNAFKCPYCGSTFNPGSTIKETHQPSKGLPYYDADAKERYLASLNNGEKQVAPKRQETASGAIAALLLFIGLVILICIVIANEHNGGGHSSAIDSLTVDTTTSVTKTDTLAPEKSSPNDDILKQLSLIKIDSITFRKLYKAARKKRDQFSGSTFIYDKSSPQYVNYNAMYAYIDKISEGSTLRFCIQYTASEWLFIKRINFNAVGENYDYEPTFKTDSGDGSIWEWSDEGVDDSYLPVLAKIATSKKAQAKYNGDKYYKVVAITPLQKAALKKQLQIYKGLLLGYDK